MVNRRFGVDASRRGKRAKGIATRVGACFRLTLFHRPTAPARRI